MSSTAVTLDETSSDTVSDTTSSEVAGESVTTSITEETESTESVESSEEVAVVEAVTEEFGVEMITLEVSAIEFDVYNDTEYWYNDAGVLISTSSSNGDWWILDISSGTQCYFYYDDNSEICYFNDGEYTHYYI